MGQSKSTNTAEIQQDFLLPNLKAGEDEAWILQRKPCGNVDPHETANEHADGATKYLQKISEVVSKHSRSEITLKQLCLVIGPLDVTAYRDDPEMLEEWEQFYLPAQMFMRVIGFLKNFPCNEPNDELVLMVCEDGKVFAYEHEKLHLVANSLKCLVEVGVKFPGANQYHRGERFKNMRDSDWEKVKKVEKLGEQQATLEELKQTYLMAVEQLY